MFVAISPVQKKPIEKQKNVQKKESEEPVIVTLAPFTGNPKVFFDNIPVGTTATRKIVIRNPLNNNIELSIRENWPDDLQLKLNWYQNTIQKNGELSLEIEWTPDKIGDWRFILILEDGRKIRKDIPIALKSYQEKVKNKTKKPKYVTKKVISPVKLMKKSPKTKSSPSNQPPHLLVNKSSSDSLIQNKENQEPNYFSNNEIRRETYTIFKSNLPILYNNNTSSSSPKLKELSFNTDPVFEDSLEENSTKTFTITPCKDNDKKSLNFTSTSTPTNVTDVLNISHETYTKNNTSTKTYIINGNISTTTYVKNSSVGNLNLLSSPDFMATATTIKKSHSQNLSGSGAKGVIQANLWCDDTDKVTSSVCSITKDSFCESSFLNKSLKRKSTNLYKITPPKRPNIEKGITTWSKGKPMAWRINKISSGLRIKHHNDNNNDMVGVTETITREVLFKNPFLSAATYNIDPFLNQYFEPDPEWLDEQIKHFTNWLNALLTPPTELSSTKEGPVDVAQLWLKCKKKEIAVAPTKETLSIEYHTNSRLTTLRLSALKLLKLPEIRCVLTKVNSVIDDMKLSIRKDRDIHLDLGLQSQIMTVLLSYNSLWLRIGLETIYNTIIPLNSNSDIIGLSTFLMQRFFRNPNLLKKYKTVHCPKYTEAIKIFILKKFLTLIYFLDQAKMRKLIKHDPCLFCKNAPIKDSREALFLFARETLSAVGDITKYLKHFGYIVQHKQTYINEFDYAVRCLGVDLRDGVRLTKIMEIILMKDNLIKQLRVPAISRVQKIYNMEIVFNELKSAGYEIQSDIDPRDIVDGHKEKTLSFLWQIIYKFQAPLLVKSCTTIQKWWRNPNILQKRQELRKIYLEKDQAVRTIQLWYKRIKSAQYLEEISKNYRLYIEYCRRNRAAIKIQSFIRMRSCRREYLRNRQQIIERKNEAAVKIQSFFKMFLVKKQYEQLRWAIIVIQNRFRTNQLCRIQQQRFLAIKTSTLIIQQYYRNYKLMRIQRANYLQQRNSIIKIQQWFRSILIMRTTIAEFLSIKANTIIIQRRFRANLIAKQQRRQYLKIRESIIKIQQYYRSYSLMKNQKNDYLRKREAIIKIQRWVRLLLIRNRAIKEFESIKYATLMIQQRFQANKSMRIQRDSFKSLKNATIVIQNRYRALQLMRKSIEDYQKLKNSTIVIQRRYRAKLIAKQQRRLYLQKYQAINTIQRKYRATLLMREEVKKFQKIKTSTILIQRWFRNVIITKQEHEKYLRLRQSIITIQKYYRGYQLMKSQRNCYQQKKEAIIKIQKWFKSIVEMKRCMNEFKNLKTSTIIIQQRFRANKSMKLQRDTYQSLKQATIIIQKRYRSVLIMRKQSEEYKRIKSVIISFQKRFRAKFEGRQQRERYTNLRQAVIKIQQFYRCYLLMKNQRQLYLKKQRNCIQIQRWFRGILARNQAVKEYENIKKSTLIIQRRFRANQLMKIQRKSYSSLKKATIIIQKRYRSLIVMRQQFNDYQKLKSSTIIVQRRFRANRSSRIHRQQYLKIQKSILTIQQYWRAYQLMKFEKLTYLEKRNATIKIQRWFRSILLRNQTVEEFKNIKKSTLIIQKRFRANQLMKIERKSYLSLKKATIIIQKRYRSLLVMRQYFNDYQKLKSSTIIVQRRFRANRSSRIQREQYLRIYKSILTIQQYWRAYQLMKYEQLAYLEKLNGTIKIQRWFRSILLRNQAIKQFTNIKKATIILQNRFRAYRASKLQHQQYLNIRKAAIIIQQYWRTYQLMKFERLKYLQKREAIIRIQKWFRGLLLMRMAIQQFKTIKEASCVIQRRFRATKLMQIQRNNYLTLKQAVIVIQIRFKAILLMRKHVDQYKNLKKSTIIIQRRYREILARKRLQLAIINRKKLETIITLQKYIRGYLIRKRYAWQLSEEAKQERRLLKIQNENAKKIQAVWKGYRLRKQQNGEIMLIRKRSQEATDNAQIKDTLSQRCNRALICLEGGSASLVQMLHALEEIDFTTRHCQNICLKLSPFLSENMYRILIAGGRSLPEMLVCRAATLILTNFFRYLPSRQYAWKPIYLDKLLTIMLHWCDKEATLFPALCTLFWLFLQYDEYKLEILKIPELQIKLLRIKSLLIRKQKMVQRVTAPNGSVFYPSTTHYLPNTKPDWGIDLPMKPRTFNNSFFGFECIVSILRQ